jgi:hypothetical protein
MSFDPNVAAMIDRMMQDLNPTAGDDQAVLTYDHASGKFTLTSKEGGVEVGTLRMFLADISPAGWLDVGATYNYDDYPALGALFGASAGETFDVPDVVFVKKGTGADIGTTEEQSVGDHPHTFNALGNHDHSLGINNSESHRHSMPYGGGGGQVAAGSGVHVNWDGTNTGYDGVHSHSGSAYGKSAGTPSMVAMDPTVNQPACTVVKMMIKA